MATCDACGNPKVMISMGGAMLCRRCSADVRAEMDQLRAEGKPVNGLHIARRKFREEHSGGDYLLRDIPKDLWQAAKHRAVDEGSSLRDLLIEALRKYLA